MKKAGLMLLLILGATLGLTLPKKEVFAGSPGSVIINELMYNPSSGNQDDEFLELHNTTGGTIDLTGWCFSSGITLGTPHTNPTCFSAGTVIAANGYLVVSPNPTRTNLTYGVTAAASYAGTSLSNGGESVTLVDETNQVIDTVSYDDASPWPASPDGNGPSLELRDPLLDNTLAASWAASFGSPTPGAQNSWVGVTTPFVSSVSDANGVLPSASVTVTASVQSADAVSLLYRVGFGLEQTITMYDDGAHGDGVAGDFSYGATIPGQAAGSLVRYKVEATNGSGTVEKPGNDEAINYYGYVVQDSSVVTNAPVINWFMDEDEHDALRAEVDGVTRYPCVIAYGDDVYDNAEVRRKGNNTFNMPKQNYKFYLPSGYKIQIDGAERAIDEFHFNADYKSVEISKVPTVWWAAREIGLPTPDVLTVRAQLNGQFEGLYNFIDKYEAEWREDYGYTNGTMYEDLIGQVMSGTGDGTDILAWKDSMVNMDRVDPAKRDYVLDNNNIQNLINALAFQAALWHHDNTDHHNIISYIDSSNQRWSILHWDFDGALSCCTSGPARLKTLASAFDIFELDENRKWYFTAIYEQPDLREMYLRRLRTIYDKLYANDALLNKYNQLSTLHQADNTLDTERWGTESRTTKALDLEAIARQKLVLGTYLRNSWGIPAAQSSDIEDNIEIGQVSANALDSEEYITISNNGSSAVDISGWRIDQVGLNMPEGSVVPANGTVYFVKNDISFRASHASVIILGEFATDLGVSGLLTLAKGDGTIMDNYSY